MQQRCYTCAVRLRKLPASVCGATALQDRVPRREDSAQKLIEQPKIEHEHEFQNTYCVVELESFREEEITRADDIMA